MRSRIFSYLFIFAVLFILFQYVNTKRYVETSETRISTLKAENKKLSDSIETLSGKHLDPGYFSLAGNEEALSYFDALSIDDLAHYIADKLIATNEIPGDNPLIPYAGVNGPMKINKIKLLNHKWLIADFSDGKQWGELLIAYEFTTESDIEFTVMKHLLYSNG